MSEGPRISVTVHGENDDRDRTFVLDESSLTSRNATQREADANYLVALVRGHKQRAAELADLAAEQWARRTRQEEKMTT